MGLPESHYQAYLLRLWMVEDEDISVWRATLENAHTGERRGFSSLEALYDYLNSTSEGMSQRARLPSEKSYHSPKNNSGSSPSYGSLHE